MPQEIPSLRFLYLYVAGACNLKCKHCWITPTYAKEIYKPEVSIEEYMEAVKQAIPLGLQSVKLTGGEPFLREDLPAFIEELQKLDIGIIVETNATLITDEIAQLLCDVGAKVSVSLDGGTAETHDTLRGVKGAFQHALTGIETLVKHKVSLYPIMAVYKENYHEVESVVNLCSELGIGFINLIPITPTGRAAKLGANERLLGVREYVELVRRVEQELSSKYEIKISVALPPAFFSMKNVLKRITSCGFHSLLSVLSNGDITFCGGYTKAEWIMGTVKKDFNLREIWENNSFLREYREKVPRKLEGVCSLCMLRPHCGGACRNYATTVYKELTAPSPFCQMMYEAGLFPQNRLLPKPAFDKARLEWKTIIGGR